MEETDDAKSAGSRPPQGLPVYRLLTGPDDVSFCPSVSEALAMGIRCTVHRR
jgi:hypothetical protein